MVQDSTFVVLEVTEGYRVFAILGQMRPENVAHRGGNMEDVFQYDGGALSRAWRWSDCQLHGADTDHGLRAPSEERVKG
jgi:hypothetical protein